MAIIVMELALVFSAEISLDTPERPIRILPLGRVLDLITHAAKEPECPRPGGGDSVPELYRLVDYLYSAVKRHYEMSHDNVEAPFSSQ